MSSSNVYVVKDIEDFNKILKHYKCVILKAGADWCVPCKTIEPLFRFKFLFVTVFIINFEEPPYQFFSVKRPYRLQLD